METKYMYRVSLFYQILATMVTSIQSAVTIYFYLQYTDSSIQSCVISLQYDNPDADEIHKIKILVNPNQYNCLVKLYTSPAGT